MDLISILNKIKFPSRSVLRFGNIQEKRALWADRNADGSTVSEEFLQEAALQAARSANLLAGFSINDVRIQYLISNGPGAASPLEEKLFCGYYNCWQQIWHMRNTIALNMESVDRFSQNLFSFMEDPANTVHIRNPGEKADPFFTELGEVSGVNRLEEKLDELIQQTATRLESGDHPLVIIPLFLASFAQLRPYSDFNVHIMLLLSHFLLLKSGYLGILTLPVEKIFQHNNTKFQNVLFRASAVLGGAHQTPDPFLKFFLKCIELSLDHGLETKVINMAVEVAEVHPLDKEILTLLKKNESLKVGNFIELTGANRSTLKVHLKKLVEIEQIKQHGQRKGTFYTLA